VHLASAYLKQGAPAIPRVHPSVDCRCTSITPGAPVKIAGAPGDARCAHRLPGAPGIRVFETGRIYLPFPGLICGPQMDFDNARRIL
jgi:hypothetical protein